MSPNDPESRTTRMKDGTTHLAYKKPSTCVVDLDTDLVLAATIYPADRADTDTLAESVVQVPQLNVIECGKPGEHQRGGGRQRLSCVAETLTVVNETLGIRTYIPEPNRKMPWDWSERPPSRRCAVTGRPPLAARGAEQEAATAAERVDGADVCSCVRNRRSETVLVAWNVRGLEALSVASRRAQSGA